VTTPLPLAGQHTDEVLGEVLGLTPEAVAELRARAAI
jgi:crotonobetainyl-CoA:carnitine CoA-transferase CaiB-like acyl-CoA transferase